MGKRYVRRLAAGVVAFQWRFSGAALGAVGHALFLFWPSPRRLASPSGQSVLVIEPFLAIIVGPAFPGFCPNDRFFTQLAEGLAVQGSSGGFDAVWECCQVATKTHFGKSAVAQACKTTLLQAPRTGCRFQGTSLS